MDPYQIEVERLTYLYDAVPSDIEVAPNSESSGSDSDHEEFSDHETDSEQEWEVETDEVQELEDQNDRRQFYFGKDGTKWRKIAPPRNVRTRQENIVSHLPGTIREARNSMTPINSWNLLFDSIVDLVVEYTNLYIQEISTRYQDKHDALPTTKVELKAFFGLLYCAGIERGAKKNLCEFYGDDGMGSEIFVAAMSQRRFRFLMRAIRFDNKDTRKERLTSDKLAAIREIFELFNLNCKQHYSVGEYVTLDEMLLAFRGRCSFRMYIPNKPSKYGIKIFSTVDARTFYTSHMEIYAGVQPEGPFRLDNSTAAVTLRMCQHLSGSGRNITMDRWFTSYPIIEKLLKEHRLTVVGTIKSNKRELPAIVTQIRDRPVPSSVFAFESCITVVSYTPKKAKNVLLISSLHHDDQIDYTTGDAQKPEINTFYNGTKSGVDVVDKMSSSYNVARGTKRWPLVIFFGMLNIAGINAFVVTRHNNPETPCRRLFLKQLALELVKGNIAKRATMQNLPRSIRQAAAKYAEVTLDDQPDPPPNKRGTGTFGRVLLCKNKNTEEYGAMKILCLADVIRLKQVEHVKNEKNILQEIRYPFVVNLLWANRDESCIYMLFEYVCGGELFSYLRNAGRFSTSTGNFYSCEIVAALEYLHAKNIVYRDLKPENLLLDKEGHLKITDFGFAKKLTDRTWTLCGTPEYLAPEIIQSKGHNKAVDWWALGVLIYEMLAGYPPFYDDNPFGIYEKILSGKIEWAKNIDPIAKDIIKKLLVQDRTKRLGNMKSGADDVKRHRWFKGIDWQDVIQRKLIPPIVPKIMYEGDTSNFDEYPEGDWKNTRTLEDDELKLFEDF